MRPALAGFSDAVLDDGPALAEARRVGDEFVLGRQRARWRRRVKAMAGALRRA